MFKWIRRIILGFLGLVVLSIVLLVGWVVSDSVWGNKASDFTNVTYLAEDGETTLVGYLAEPDEDGQFPAVLMVHEWWGVNPEVIELAESLADEGYVVLVPDTYRGATTDIVPRALYLRLNVPEERVDSDMQAAFDYLSNLESVDASRIGVMGFCYGGGVALYHAVNNENIVATINLYGDTIVNPDEFGALLNDDAGPVLSIFGGIDNMIPLTEVTAYQQAMDSAGIQNTVSIYEDMGHAFVQPDVIDQDGQPRDAWLEILAFFEEHLQHNSDTSD